MSCLVTAISPFVGITWHVTIVNPRPSQRRQHNAVQLYELGAACQKQPMQYLQYHPPQTLLTDASVTMPLTTPPLSLGSRDAPLWLVLVPVERCLG